MDNNRNLAHLAQKQQDAFQKLLNSESIQSLTLQDLKLPWGSTRPTLETQQDALDVDRAESEGMINRSQTMIDRKYMYITQMLFTAALAAADEGKIIRRTAWPQTMLVYGIHDTAGMYWYCQNGGLKQEMIWTPTSGDMNASDWEAHDALSFFLKWHPDTTLPEHQARVFAKCLGRKGEVVGDVVKPTPDRWIDWGLTFPEAFQLMTHGVRVFRSSWENHNFIAMDEKTGRIMFWWGEDQQKEPLISVSTGDIQASDWGVVVQEPEHKIAMSFSEAVDALRCGQSITRSVWRAGYRIRLTDSGNIGAFSGTENCSCDECDERTFKLSAADVLSADWLVYQENSGELPEANQSTAYKGPRRTTEEDWKIYKEVAERKPEDVERVIAAGINHLSAHLVFNEAYKDNLLGGRLCFRDDNTVLDKMPELEPLEVTLAVPKALKLKPELITHPGEGGEDAYLSLFVAEGLLDHYRLGGEWADLVCNQTIKLLQQQTLRFAEPDEKIDTKIKVKVFIPSILLKTPEVTAFHRGAVVTIRALHKALKHCPKFIKAWAIADMERHLHGLHTEQTLSDSQVRWEWLESVADQLTGTWLQKVHVLKDHEFTRLKDLEHLHEVSLKNFEGTGTRTHTGNMTLSSGLNAILENALELARQDWIREGKPLKGPVDVTVASDAYVELGAPWLAHASEHARFLTAMDVIENGSIVRKFRFEWKEPAPNLTAAPI